MLACPAYHLTFRAPLHVGERGVGLETTRTHVPADTLFSAVCSAWRLLYGEDQLGRDLLDWYGTFSEEPLYLTSAFPFAGPVRFFPRPLGRLPHVTVSEDDAKAFKRLRFVSAQIFEAVIRGERLSFTRNHCINGEVAWVSAEEKRQLSDWTNDATGDIVLWKTDVVPRVTLDRMTSASEIWHFGEVSFAEGVETPNGGRKEVGLWFAVDFNVDHGEDLRRRFEAALRMLGDTGLGGKRGVGRGLFDFATKEVALPETAPASQFVTLAPCCPRTPEECATLTAEGAAYELLPRRGWITSPEASNLRRKTVWMFAEGSVLTGPVRPRSGRLVDVRPELCPHPVWRYGYAWPVGMRCNHAHL